jgi:SAM-dependent methyltransferase
MQIFRTKYSSVYDREFYARQVGNSSQSARLIVPLLMRLFGPKSVVDVGCGIGPWLRAFGEEGVAGLCGIDGNYVSRDELLFDPAKFISKDLSRPFEVPGYFDLAMCLEVAEHLPTTAGRHLVHTITRAAPLVLFSAAVPGQGGSHHVNEQWPSYWRSLFAAEGFRIFDPIRPLIRSNTAVRWWYRQNLLVFASQEGISAHPLLGQEVAIGEEMEWVHIAMLERKRDLRSMLHRVPGVTWAWSYLKPWMRSRMALPGVSTPASFLAEDQASRSSDLVGRR